MRAGELASFSSRRERRSAPAAPVAAREEQTDLVSVDDFALPSGEPIELHPNRPVVFTGFNDAKLRRPLELAEDGLPKSAKYTFASLALTSRSMPQTRAQAEYWFETHIRPGMESAGFRVGWVRGDQALIATRERPTGEMVSFMRGAGSGNPAYVALSWEVAGTEAAEVTAMAEDPLGLSGSHPMLRLQQALAKAQSAAKASSVEQMQRELKVRIRMERISAGGW